MTRGYSYNVQPYLDKIKRLQDYVFSIPFEKFYEPVSAIKKHKIIYLTSDLVNAWVRHVCYASRVRMLNFEQGALAELSTKRLLTAMALIRSHMEASGMACLCHYELRKWLETKNSSSIEELIPQTFFGTSMVKAQKKAEVIGGMLHTVEQDGVIINQVISAMDDFLSCGKLPGYAHVAYALLCEYTHPSMRAVKDYIDTQEHPVEGWLHCYRMDADLNDEECIEVLKVLLTSMKAGHAVCEILRRTKLGSHDTEVYIEFPEKEDMLEIWDSFLKWPERLSSIAFH